MWGIRAGKNGSGHDVFMQSSVIALEDAAMEDLSKLAPNREHFYEKYRKLHPGDTRAGSAGIAGKFFRFAVEVQKGDLVVYPCLMDKCVYIGKVIGTYEYKKDHNQFPHQRHVKWKFVIPKSHFSMQARYELGAARTFFEFKNNADELRNKITSEGVVRFRRSVAPTKKESN